MIYEKVRLRKQEIDAIIQCFARFFDPSDHLWIFGSRVSLEKKGGDIDLYVETSCSKDELLSRKIRFLVELKILIGDQKIDVVMNHLPSGKTQDIYAEARKTGIQLV